jgi:Transglycosylase SLT domain
VNTQQKIVLLGLAGLATWYYLENQDDVNTAAQGVWSDAVAAVAGWQNAGSGPTWIPILNQAEQSYGLPQNLLAAVAYQESSFIENVIRGITPSSDGLSLGMMQLQTRYYPSLVGPGVAVPYTDQNVSDQISEAGQIFATNYQALGSWPQTISAYNEGLSGVQTNGILDTAYVSSILANAPAANV